MASLDMQKAPLNFESVVIDTEITQTSAGNYALGYLNDENKFIVMYVGRSDTDLKARLKQHLDKHPKFKWSYASSSKTAFEKECKNFHDFGGTEKLENDIHPDRPKNSNWKCPGCSNFD
jgi:hypothetical protein